MWYTFNSNRGFSLSLPLSYFCIFQNIISFPHVSGMADEGITELTHDENPKTEENKKQRPRSDGQGSMLWLILKLFFFAGLSHTL